MLRKVFPRGPVRVTNSPGSFRTLRILAPGWKRVDIHVGASAAICFDSGVRLNGCGERSPAQRTPLRNCTEHSARIARRHDARPCKSYTACLSEFSVLTGAIVAHSAG